MCVRAWLRERGRACRCGQSARQYLEGRGYPDCMCGSSPPFASYLKLRTAVSSDPCNSAESVEELSNAIDYDPDQGTALPSPSSFSASSGTQWSPTLRSRPVTSACTPAAQPPPVIAYGADRARGSAALSGPLRSSSPTPGWVSWSLIDIWLLDPLRILG